jgi:hypothetical protein
VDLAVPEVPEVLVAPAVLADPAQADLLLTRSRQQASSLPTTLRFTS